MISWFIASALLTSQFPLVKTDISLRRSGRLKPSPERCPAADRRPLHDDEAGALEVLDQALGDVFGHDLVGVVDALAALKARCEGERRGEVESRLNR
jgi:hypothetical protein